MGAVRFGAQNTPAPGRGPWPLTSAWHGGQLWVGGVSAQSLAERYGTPLYIMDEADMRYRASLYRDAFEREFSAPGLAGADVYYAGKAFLSVEAARWMHSEGLRIDTASGVEMAIALRAGVPGAHIALHGNNKSDEELEAALDAEVGRIVVDSLAEIEQLNQIAAARGVIAPCMIRVTTGVHAGGHSFIATAHEDQKFGLSLAAGTALRAAIAITEASNLRLDGLHGHIGSQILKMKGFRASALALLTLRKDIYEQTGTLVPEVDLGGGYGIPYLPTDPEGPSPAKVARKLAAVVVESCKKYDLPAPRISVEPGRSIAGRAGITLYRVGTVKPVELDEGASRLYVSVDGGMSDNLRPALYGANYTAALASRESRAEPVESRVVGKHCESGDIVVRDVSLPGDITRGDLLVVPVTGAYGRVMASSYNQLPRPGVVAVKDGESRILIRRETMDDILGYDQG